VVKPLIARQHRLLMARGMLLLHTHAPSRNHPAASAPTYTILHQRLRHFLPKWIPTCARVKKRPNCSDRAEMKGLRIGNKAGEALAAKKFHRDEVHSKVKICRHTQDFRRPQGRFKCINQYLNVKYGKYSMRSQKTEKLD
jgi:hypothetical protein